MLGSVPADDPAPKDCQGHGGKRDLVPRASDPVASSAAPAPSQIQNRPQAEQVAVHATRAAYELGLAKPPKRTTPRVVAGIVIGASAVYFLEPESGPKHRKKVVKLVS